MKSKFKEDFSIFIFKQITNFYVKFFFDFSLSLENVENKFI